MKSTSNIIEIIYRFPLIIKLLIVLIFTFLPLIFFRKEVEFAVDIFINEWLKFMLFSLGWVLIANEFIKRKKRIDSFNVKKQLLTNIIINPCLELINAINNKDIENIRIIWQFIINNISDDYIKNFFAIDDLNIHIQLNKFKNEIDINNKSIESVIQSIKGDSILTNPFRNELLNYLRNFQNNIQSCL